MRRATLPALLLLVGFAAMAALYAWGGGAYFALREAAGLQAFVPFLDLHGVMAAIECWQDGVDVYSVNTCDHLGRVHVYSPLWLRLPGMFGAPELTMPIGIGLALAFILSLLVVPAPTGAGGMVVLVLAVVSPDTVFALERANMDVLIFAAVVLAVPMLAGGLVARGFAYAVFLAVGLLKFYPLVLLGLVVRERPVLTLLFGAAALGGLAAVALPLAGEFGRAIGNILPTPVFSGTFGARHLGLGLGLLLPGYAGVAVGVLVAAAAVMVAVRLARDTVVRGALDALPRRDADLLLVGAVLMLGCFLAGENVEYRAIFLLLTVPALWRMGGMFAATAGCVAWLMWDPVVRRVVARLVPGEGEIPGVPGLALWTVREVLWWWVAVVLAGLVVGLLRRAPGWALIGVRPAQ